MKLRGADKIRNLAGNTALRSSAALIAITLFVGPPGAEEALAALTACSGSDTITGTSPYSYTNRVKDTTLNVASDVSGGITMTSSCGRALTVNVTSSTISGSITGINVTSKGGALSGFLNPLGGGGGNIAVTNAAAITTTGADSLGINAVSTVDLITSITDSKTVTVTSTGNISTSGSGATGINAVRTYKDNTLQAVGTLRSLPPT